MGERVVEYCGKYGRWEGKIREHVQTVEVRMKAGARAEVSRRSEVKWRRPGIRKFLLQCPVKSETFLKILVPLIKVTSGICCCVQISKLSMQF